jgi:predicted phage-related endonuclease
MLATIKELSYDFQRRIEKYKTAQETEWYELTNGAEAARIFDDTTKSTVDLPDAEPIVERILSLRETITDAEAEIGKLEGQIMMEMRDSEMATANRYQITWPTMNYKAVPAKTVPAKPARTIRISKLRIKERV